MENKLEYVYYSEEEQQKRINKIKKLTNSFSFIPESLFVSVGFILMIALVSAGDIVTIILGFIGIIFLYKPITERKSSKQLSIEINSLIDECLFFKENEFNPIKATTMIPSYENRYEKITALYPSLKSFTFWYLCKKQ